MSDGPHKSLPMRPWWKEVAKRADMNAWSVEQVSDAVCAAVSGDYKREVTGEFMTALDEVIGASRQTSLFAEQGAEQLKALRALSAPGSFSESITDYAELALGNGLVGDRVLQKAFGERGGECARQVEEHYKLKAGAAEATRVRGRLERGLRSSDFAALAKNLLGAGSNDTEKRANKKDGGLDAGPVLDE